MVLLLELWNRHSSRTQALSYRHILLHVILFRMGSLGVVGWCDGAWVNFQCRCVYTLDDSRARAYCS